MISDQGDIADLAANLWAVVPESHAPANPVILLATKKEEGKVNMWMDTACF